MKSEWVPRGTLKAVPFLTLDPLLVLWECPLGEGERERVRPPSFYRRIGIQTCRNYPGDCGKDWRSSTVAAFRAFVNICTASRVGQEVVAATMAVSVSTECCFRRPVGGVGLCLYACAAFLLS